MEEKNLFEKECKIHKEKENMYCKKDSIFICPSCITSHEGHGVIVKKELLQIGMFNKIGEEIEKKREIFIEMKKELMNFHNFIDIELKSHEYSKNQLVGTLPIKSNKHEFEFINQALYPKT